MDCAFHPAGLLGHWGLPRSVIDNFTLRWCSEKGHSRTESGIQYIILESLEPYSQHWPQSKA